MEVFHAIWSVIEPVHELLLAVAISLTTALLLWMFRARVKIVWGSTSLNFHNFRLRQDSAPVTVSTEKFYVQNVGRKSASSVEIVFSAAPTSYTLWPPRDHVAKLAPSENFLIQVPSLAPFELLIVDVIELDLKQIDLVAVNCPDVLSKQVRFGPQRLFGRPVTAMVGYLMLSGLIGTVYLFLQILLGANQ